MNPLVIVLPLALIAGGVAVFLLLPLPLPLRTAVLAADTAAALLVAWVLWRRHRR